MFRRLNRRIKFLEIPDAVFVCVAAFLDSLPAQMVAYRLSEWSHHNRIVLALLRRIDQC